MRTPHLGTLMALAWCIALTGCAGAGGPPSGLLFSNVEGPLAVSGGAGDLANPGFNCFGEATAFSLFGLVTFGDAGLDKAKRNGAARTGSKLPSSFIVTHADYHWFSVLGIGRYTTRIFFYDPNAKNVPCAS